MQVTKQKVTWSITVKLITLSVGIVILFAEYSLILYIQQNWFSIYTLLTLAVFLIFLYFILGSPRYIILTDREVILQKLCGSVAIKYTNITYVDDYKYDKSDVRRIGSGGFCGYIGKFSNAKIGNYTSFVCNYNQAFLIQTNQGENYVFSCENKDSVISVIKNKNK